MMELSTSEHRGGRWESKTLMVLRWHEDGQLLTSELRSTGQVIIFHSQSGQNYTNNTYTVLSLAKVYTFLTERHLQ